VLTLIRLDFLWSLPGRENVRHGLLSENRQVEVATSRIGALLILKPVPVVPAVQWFDRLTMAGSILRSSKDALRSRR
jgi:hypothetical protein